MTTISYYENSLSYSVHKAEGCKSTNQGETGLVILDYGKPRNWGSPSTPYYGTLLIGSMQPAYIHNPSAQPDIYNAVKQFTEGYLSCRNGAPGPPLIIAPSINNDVQYSPAELTTAHAQAWAAMIKQLQYDYRTRSEVAFAAGIDAEPDFALPIPPTPINSLTPTATPPPDAGFPPVATWTTGYSNQNVSDYYDFGSLDGYPCPPYPTPTPLPASLPCSVWSIDKDYIISTGINRARVLPEIYRNLMGREWYLVKRWGYEQYGVQKDVQGEMTECGSSNCTPVPAPASSNAEFNGEDAWKVIWLELNSDAATSQQDPPYSTDICGSLPQYQGCPTDASTRTP